MPEMMEVINRMTHEEKLHAMDMLWTSILSSSGAYDPPAWHQAVLNERRRAVESGDAKFVPWEAAKHELRMELSC